MEFYHTHFDCLPSTNTHATDLIAKSNPIPGTVISTYNQTDGNGQIGRKWYSDVNKNITTSIILCPSFLSIDKVFYLNIVLSLAVRSVIARLTECEITIKWPNDIYYQNKKLAGLLIQQSLLGKKIVNTVLGYGVNVNQIEFPSHLPNPISIYNIYGVKYDLDQVQKELLQSVEVYYSQLLQHKYVELKKEYLSYMYGRGEVREFVAEGERFSAEILGIDTTGKLSLNRNGKIFHFELNQIQYII